MDYYISKENVAESIKYFKESDIQSDSLIFLYLLAKKMGITVSNPVSFDTKNLRDSGNFNNFMETLWKFGGMFDQTEEAGKNALIFPFSFLENNEYSTSPFYNGGTKFKSLAGRVRDTVRNTSGRPLPISLNQTDNLVYLSPDYIEMLRSSTYLNNQKISLFHLAVWIYRFDAFEFDKEPTSQAFNKLIKNLITKELRISRRNFEWLFIDDFDKYDIVPSRQGISGQEIRELLNIESNPNNNFNVEIIDVNTDNEILGNDHRMASDEVEKNINFDDRNPTHDTILEALISSKQIILTGVPGIGKTRYTQRLANDDFFTEVELIQFHANYTYEDFIGGETLEERNGSTIVSTQMGVFLEVIEKAKASTDNFLLVIDEINRADIASVFGETIGVLDREYEITLNRPIKGIDVISIPENLYIVGTMNTTDRNIAFLDMALRRRFSFIPLLPDYDFLNEEVTLEVSNRGVKRNYLLGGILKDINDKIYRNMSYDETKLLGQSYFIPKKSKDEFLWTKSEFHNQFNFKILPTLKEYNYQKDNVLEEVLGEELSEVIYDEELFYDALSIRFSEMVRNGI